jgi:glycerol uptake facilitator protein
MNYFLSELIGTALLLLLGTGVVANVVLNKTKGQNSGWIVITFGWAMAVFVAVYAFSKHSGAHLNPAVTLALMLKGVTPVAKGLLYMLAQLLGAMLGSTLTWLVYRNHFEETTDAGLKRAVFCTDPAIPNTFLNLFSEFIGTFVLVLGVFMITGPEQSLGALDALPVAFLVLAIGLSLGGTTGYAINPARDLGPRIMHAILPIGGKTDSNWKYAWIPVLGPFLGATLAVLCHNMLLGAQ